MTTITIEELIELNRILEEKNLQSKIHLRDACGGQSFWIETLDNSDIPAQLYDELDIFFSQRNINIKFNNSRTEFWSK